MTSSRALLLPVVGIVCGFVGFLVGKEGLVVLHVRAPNLSIKTSETGGSPFLRNQTKTTTIGNNNNFEGVVARPFQPWPKERGLPCFATDVPLFDVPLLDEIPSNVGFLYQKPPKCASTTTAGVNLRIARNVAQRVGLLDDDGDKMMMCDNRWSHGKSHERRKPATYATRFRYRNQDKSFLWSIIREPTSRYVSHFFFGPITGKKAEPNLESFQTFVAKWPQRFYNCVLSTKRSYNCMETDLTDTEIVQELNEILNEYDFIGVTERYDESLVVLMMLLDLRMADILYFSSKRSGGFAMGRGRGHACLKIPPKTGVSEDMQKYIDNSPEWQDRVHFDMLLHQAANRSLDLTIDRVLGRQQVQENVSRFQYAQKVAAEKCENVVVLPCSQDGAPQLPEDETDCYRQDVGCGMDCLDEVATELDLW